MENPKDSTKELLKFIKYSNITGHRFDMQKSTAFLHISKKMIEKWNFKNSISNSTHKHEMPEDKLYRI